MAVLTACLKKTRSTGMDVATTVMAVSAVDQMTELYAWSTLVSSFQIESFNSLQERSWVWSCSTYLARRIDVTPAKIPRLMATPTPIFSAVRICRFQRTFQGNNAREMSMMAAHIAWNLPYITEGSLSIHVPGRISTKVFVIGLHSTQGRTATGIANKARVAIANQT